MSEVFALVGPVPKIALYGVVMKKKILLLLLLVSLCVSSLSSCLLISGDGLLGELSNNTGNGGGDKIINVEGGDTYDNINITADSNSSLMAASKAMLSSVSIVCAFDVKSGYTTKQTASAGSGVIYKLDKEKGDAYVITNYHVVYNEDSLQKDCISNDIRLYLYGMEMMTSEEKTYAIPAEYVGGSMMYDIAVLKVTGSETLIESNARSVDVADSNNVTVLDTAIAIGNPGGGGLSATVGYINVDSEEITIAFEIGGVQTGVELRVMRTDAAVNSGNSGGGLFNESGELIGIVNAKSSDMTEENIGYAIPSNVAIAIAKNAIDYSDGSIWRCMLGVTVGVKKYSTEYDIETGKIKKIEDVVILEISDGAAVEGVLKVGDVINSITINGVTMEVTRVHHVVDYMLNARVGDIVKTNVTRDGETIDTILTITESMLKNWRYPS